MVMAARTSALPEVGLQHDQPCGTARCRGRAETPAIEATVRRRERGHTTMSAILANSEGCIWNVPNWNHAWLPLISSRG